MKRADILDTLEARLRTIQAGETVGTGEAVHVYTNSVGLITRRMIEPDSLDEGEFPAVSIRAGEVTTFRESDDLAYQAEWSIGLRLTVRDAGAPSLRDSDVLELLESLFVDVDAALHLGGSALEHSPDVAVALRSWQPIDFGGSPIFGEGLLIISIPYSHLSFD